MPKQVRYPIINTTRDERVRMGNEDLREKLYNLKQRIANAEKVVLASKISDIQKRDILAFRDWQIARGISLIRVIKQLILARIIAEAYPKDFRDYTAEDASAVMAKLRLSQKEVIDKSITDKKTIERGENKKNVSRYSTATLSDMSQCLKAMFRMLDKVPDGQQSPRTAHIKAKKGATRYSEKDLPTPTEVLALIQGGIAAGNLKLATWVSVTYELALRSHESRILTVNCCKRDSDGAYHLELPEATKTGSRPLLLIVSAGLLDKYLTTEHAFVDNGNAPLFYTLKNRVPDFWEHATMAKQFRVLSKKVLHRSLKTYILRHARLHQLHVVEKHPAPTVQLFAGHSLGSKQLAITYSHPSSRNVDNMARESSGVPVEDDNRSKKIFTAKICQNPKCSNRGKINMPFNIFCPTCNEIINPEITAIKKQEPKFDFSALNDEEREYMRSFMREEFKRLMLEKKL